MESEAGPGRQARRAFPKRRGILPALSSAAVVTALAIGVAAARAATPTSAATSSGTPAPSSASSGTPAPATTVTGTVPESVESAVYGLATKTYGNIYGGMIVISNRTQIAIYLTNLAPDTEHAFEKLAPAGRLVFRKTPHSLRQLSTVHDSLRRQWNALVNDGINVNEFGPDIQLGREDIGIVSLTASQAARLDNMFGAGMIHVYNVTPKQAHAIVGLARHG